MLPRLASAFGLVLEGNLDLARRCAPALSDQHTEFSFAYRDVASGYLIEAARRSAIRNTLYKPLEQGTRDEKIQLSRILSVSGDEASIPFLEKVSRDNDGEVAQEGLRALRSLRARLKV
jgi:hypothetical protein